MIICSMLLHFEITEFHSLKERRSFLNGLKERLKRLNISLLDLSSDYPQEATMAIAFLSPNGALAAQYRERIESTIDAAYPQYRYEIEYEEI